MFKLKNLIKPYDDNYLVYDIVNHRYLLAPTNPLIDRSIYGDNAQKIQITLEKISRLIYNFIRSRANTNNFPFVELCISCTEDGRNMIKNAMESQLLADMESGQTDIVNESPIDFNRGLVIDRKTIRENRICVDSEDIIKNNQTPINYLYAGDYGIRLSNDRYKLWSY